MGFGLICPSLAWSCYNNAYSGSFFIPKSAVACVDGTHTKHEGPLKGRGCQPGCIVVRLLCFYIRAILTTRGWVFPRCSAEQSGHLILTDTNTRTHRRKHADTHMEHTVHAACSCCQWCQSWFGQTSLLFHSMNTEERRRRLHLAEQPELFCL